MLHRLGAGPFATSDGLGAVFGALSLPLAYAVVRLARPHGRGDAALLAAALLAGSSQHLIWAGAGLENSLFAALMLAGVVRLDHECSAGGPPLSAVLMFLLALTRPEGLVYAGLAALLVFDRSARRVGLRWLGVLGGLLVAWHAWRISYFAWPFPNTYYAKLGRDGVFQPFGWNAAGWHYIRSWFSLHHAAWGLPLVALALVGAQLRRWWLLVLGPGALAALVAFDGSWSGAPAWWDVLEPYWVHVRVWAIPTLASLLALTGAGLVGGHIRAWLGAAVSFGVFFALYSGGDWMEGHRWFGVIVVPLLPLAAVGAGELMDAVLGVRPGLPVVSRAALVVALAGTWTWAESSHVTRFLEAPPIEVEDVQRRVRYMTEVQRDLDLDHVVLADVDMGAHVWSTPHWEIIDYAGLLDVPIGRRTDFPPAFMVDDLLGRRLPDFFHIHGGWGERTSLPALERFSNAYLELPPQRTASGRLHHGHYLLKELLVERGAIPAGAVEYFEDDVVLSSVEVPAPMVSPGGELVVESRWQVVRRRGDIRVSAFLQSVEGGRPAVVEEHLPGLGWYRTSAWLPGGGRARADGRAVGRPLPQQRAGSARRGFCARAARRRSERRARQPP